METVCCTYCQNSIDTVRIKCVECPEFDLCLQCFSCGVEAGPHKKEHDYQVLDDGHYPLFEYRNIDWTSAQELNLQEAVEQFGFGNWNDVSDHVKDKTAEECKEHFLTYYIHGSVGKATLPSEFTKKVKDHTCPDGGPLSPSLSAPLPPVDISLQEQHLLGYMPLRDDFEREYDNEAETIISGLTLNYDDEDIDNSFKLAQVDMYRRRLHERQRRKRIAREFRVINEAAQPPSKSKSQNNKKKGSKEERDIQDKLKLFAQFHSAKEHDNFLENLQKEKHLKNRIKELMRYRRNGLTKLEEGPDFDMERYRRERKKDNKKKLGTSSTVKRTSTVSKPTEGKGDGGGGKTDTGDNETRENHREAAGLPGFDLLTSQERKLCHSIGLKPASYITIKTCIIKDYLQRRQGLPAKFRYPSHMDKTHRRKILSFLSGNGWIGGI